MLNRSFTRLQPNLHSCVFSTTTTTSVHAMTIEKATFAAGCFWSVELAYQRVPGVLSTRVGYTGGHVANPTYKQVCVRTTGHAEAVELTYDPSHVSYNALLDVFFHKHDPTTRDRQGNDHGSQYRSAIFYHTEQQHVEAEEAREKEQGRLGKEVVTEIVPAPEFWPAEEYHQKFLEKGGQCSRKGADEPIRCYG